MTIEERRNTIMAILVALVLGISLIGLNNPFIFDSVGKISSNPEIRSLSNITQTLIYPYRGTAVLNRNDPSRPVIYLTYAFNYYWGKLNPFGYHLFDILTHGASVCLIFLLVLIMTGRLYRKENEPLALMVALYFAVHPLLFGTAIYAYGRSDTLSTFLILLSLYYFAKEHEPSPTSLTVSAISFFLGLYSKQSTIVIPLVFMLFDYCIHSNFDVEFVKKRMKIYAPFLGITLFYLLHRFLYFGGMGDLEAQLGGTWDRFDYIMMQPAIFFKYLYLYLNPEQMALDRYIIAESLSTELKLLGFVGVAGVAYGIYLLWKSRYAEKRMIFFGIIYYLLFLIPTSSIMPTVDAMVDRRVYTGSFGLFLAALIFVGHSFKIEWEKIVTWTPRERIFTSVIFVHLLLLSGYSFYRNKIFNKPEDVWQSIIAIYPDSKRAINNLGLRYFNMGEFEKAIEQFNKLMRIHPDDHFPHMNIARIYGNKNNPFYEKEKAEYHYKEALKRLPEFAFTHYLYGEFLFNHERYEEAEQELLTCMNLNPNIGGISSKLAVIYEKRGDTKMAEQYYQSAAMESASSGATSDIPTTAPAVFGRQQLNSSGNGQQTTPMTFSSNGNAGMNGSANTGRQEIPVDQVDPKIIIDLYRNAIKEKPSNSELKTKFKEYCKSKGLPCQKENV